MTGSHTWANLGDFGPADPPPVFDFERYLEFLERHHHNFIRLWTWSYPKSLCNKTLYYYAPLPWPRTGPGLANDGKPRFDLSRFDPLYFTRLRDRVIAAGRRGIYVSVMLFEGGLVHGSEPPWRWDGHVFHPRNNINNVNGDPNSQRSASSVYKLQVPEITRIQEAYVRKVIDTVNDLDNVLYEVANECGGYSTAWQYHIIRFIREYEKSKPRQHPVGMTFAWSAVNSGTNEDLIASEADWISPGGRPYFDEMPAADGKKVILLDSDHLGGGLGTRTPWAWKGVCRGLNMLMMDIEDDKPSLCPPEAWREPLRRNMGYARRYAERMNLADATPCGDLVSTKYCLSDKKSGYLVYLPKGPRVQVDLTGVPGSFNVEWTNPGTGETRTAAKIVGGKRVDLASPFPGDAVLFLWKP